MQRDPHDQVEDWDGRNLNWLQQIVLWLMMRLT